MFRRRLGDDVLRSGVAATGSGVSWSSGAYVYDGTGNITRMGPAWFTYDKVNRLTAGNVYTDPLGGGTGGQQGYTFDPFGNLTAITGANARNTPTTAATNRLTTGTYDAAGNLTGWNGAVYQYDRFNQMVRMTSGSQDWAYVYTADDERIWSYNLPANVSTWTVRDLSGQVLREYTNENGAWTVGTDYIRRDGQLLAAETRSGRRHFHLDHLGTPRLITSSAGYKKAYHVYYPFGEEATAFNQDGERMKFTGHERDLASGAGAGDDLDYMHARHYSPVTGRFLSIDPSGFSAQRDRPQSWNRYLYALGNTLRYLDPDGQVWKPAPGTSPEQVELVKAIASDPGIGPAPLAMAGERVIAAGVFRLPNFLRGYVIEEMLSKAGGALAKNFPTIDRFLSGVATSVKSIDLTAKTYQVASRLAGKLRGYIDTLSKFTGASRGGFNIGEGGAEITEKVLEVAVQKGAMTPEQMKVIEQAVEYGRKSGVTVKIVEISTQ